MRTFHFFSPSDREHRLMFQAAAPEAAPTAPAAAPVEDPAVPIESPDAANAAARDGVNAADTTVAGAANAAVPNVGANPGDVPPSAVQRLQAGLALPATGPSPAPVDPRFTTQWDSMDLMTLKNERYTLRNEIKNSQVKLTIASRRGINRYNRVAQEEGDLSAKQKQLSELDKAIQDITSAEKAGKTVAEFRQERSQREEALAKAEAAAEAAKNPVAISAAPAAQAEGAGGAPPETGGDAPAPTPELALARAEQAMEDRRATTDERAAGSMQLIDATREQLIRMGESDLAVPNRDPAVRKRQEKLQSAILTNGGGIDAFKNELRTNYNNAKIDLDARRTDAMTEKAQAEGNLVRLRTELSAEQQENNPGSQADIVRLTTEIQQAEESVHELTDQIATLTNKSTTLRNEFNADMHALDDTGESTAEIAARCKGKIMSAAEILKESSSADNRQLGTLLDNITIEYIPDGIDLIPVQVTGAAVGQEEFIQTQLGNPRALQSAPRLLAALDATLKKAQATA